MFFAAVNLHKTTKYCIGGFHVPPRAAKLPNSTIIASFEDVKSSRETPFVLELPISYEVAISATQISLIYTPSAGERPITWNGWVVNVEQSASSAKACRITWTFDNWRTWSNVNFGSGVIERQPTDPHTTLNTFQGEYSLMRHALAFQETLNAPTGWAGTDWRRMLWAIVMYLSTTESGTTSISYYTWPVVRPEVNISYDYNIETHLGDGTNVRNAPTFSQTFGGILDEILQLDPMKIVGAWMSPICPCASSLTCTQSGTDIHIVQFTAKTDGDIRMVDGRPNYAVFAPKFSTAYTYGGLQWSSPYLMTGQAWGQWAQESQNMMRALMADGRIIWTRPWSNGTLVGGAGTTSGGTYNAGLSLSPDGSAAMILRFGDASAQGQGPATKLLYAEANGMVQTVPLTRIPITSNTWSSYYFSGAREYEMKVAEANSKLQENKGYYDAISGGAQSAAMAGLSSNGVGAAQALAGAVIGTAAGIIGTQATADMERDYRRQTQELKDRMMAMQSQEMLIPGSSPTHLMTTSLAFVLIEPKDNGDWYQDIQQHGYRTETAVTSWTPSTGPWRIRNLDVSGKCPATAREVFRDMLAKGIYIDAADAEITTGEEEEVLP